MRSQRECLLAKKKDPRRSPYSNQLAESWGCPNLLRRFARFEALPGLSLAGYKRSAFA